MLDNCITLYILIDRCTACTPSTFTNLIRSIMYNYYIKFYVPSTEQANKPIDSIKLSERVDLVARIFAGNFGGATVEDCTGYYTANGGELIKETIKRVVAFTDLETFNSKLEEIKQLAVNARKSWSQESIALETTNGIEFI